MSNIPLHRDFVIDGDLFVRCLLQPSQTGFVFPIALRTHFPTSIMVLHSFVTKITPPSSSFSFFSAFDTDVIFH